MTLQQTAALLTDRPGTLAYFLILAMALALIFSIAQLYRRPDSSALRWIRISTVLLALHLIHMLLTGLSWFGWVEQDILPTIDRFTSLYGLILLTTGLAINRDSVLKKVVLIISIFCALMLAFSLYASFQLAAAETFNESWMDAIWSLASLAAGVVMLIGIILSRAPLWLLTVLPLGLLTTGFGLHLGMGSTHGSLAEMVRLAEITAYPLYALLISRSIAISAEESTGVLETEQEPSTWNEMMVAIEQLNTIGNDDFKITLIIQMAHALTTTFHADICLILTAPSTDGRFSIATGYNRLQNREVPESTLSRSSCPNLYEAMVRRKSFMLADAQQLADTSSLENNLRRAIKGPLLFAPFFIEKQIFGGVLFLAPVRKYKWDPNERKSLEVLANLVANRLQRLALPSQSQPLFTQLNEEKMNEIEEDIINLRRILESASDTTRDLAEKRETLLDKYRSSQVHLVELNEQVGNLRKSLDSARVQYRQNVQKHEELQQQYEHTALRLDQQEKENNRIRRALMASNQQQERLKDLHLIETNYEQARIKMQSLEAEQNRLREALNMARSKYLVDLEKQRKILTEYRKAQTRITSLEKETERLKTDLTREEETAENKSKQLATELRMVLGELAETRTHLSDLQSKHGGSMSSKEIVEDYFALLQSLQKPLTSMKGYASLLMGESVGLLGTMQRKFLERIQISISDITQLLEEQPSLSTGNPVSTNKNYCDLSQCLEEVTSELNPEIASKNLSFEIELPDNLPQINCPSEDLRPNLQLLLLHAIIGSDPDEEISIAAVTQAGNQDQFILLSIADRGKGIPDEKLDLVFTPAAEHVQDDPDIINLSEVKNFCQNHGGKVWIYSQVGKGSTVSILIPALAVAS